MTVKRYGATALILIGLLGLAGWIVWSVVGIEQRRADYGRYIYKAVDYCSLGHMEGVMVSLTSAKQAAANDDDIDYADKLVRRFSSGNCEVPTRTP